MSLASLFTGRNKGGSIAGHMHDPRSYSHMNGPASFNPYSKCVLVLILILSDCRSLFKPRLVGR